MTPPLPEYDPITDYYVDAATWIAVGTVEAPTGDCFWPVDAQARREFPQLSSVFGVQLTPSNRVVLHSTRDAYVGAIVNAQSL